VRLRALINQQPIMLFMKGTPEEARCGFSRTMIQILSEVGLVCFSFYLLMCGQKLFW